MPIAPDSTTFLDLNLALISEDADNVRRTLSGIDELADAIRQDGVLEPILVRPHPTERGRYQVIAGHRRLAAAKQVGLITIPAVVREVNDQDKQAMQLVENVQREDLSAIEVAQALQSLMRKLGASPAEVGARVGQTANWVNKHVALLKLDPRIVTAIQKHRLTVSQAREIKAIASCEPDGIQKAIEAASALRNGTIKREDLRRKTAPNETPETGDTTQLIRVSPQDQRHFERRAKGYTVRVLVDAEIPIDGSLRARIDAALASAERIVGEAA